VKSLRSRLLIGSLLWTSGLLGISHFFFMLVGRTHSLVIRANSHVFLLACAAAMIAGLLYLRGGVSRIAHLRERLTDVREGRSERLEGTYPSEVQPLVNDLNALLYEREEAVRRAIAKAGDLAHGLKTPLAVIAQEAANAESSGSEIGTLIAQQVERMRRQIDYHLAHSRASASGPSAGVHCAVADSVDGLSRTLRRLHAERGIIIDANVTPDQTVRVRREDLDEMLGNLLDNAYRFARSRVTVASAQDGDSLAITVDDDGPGLPAAMRDAVLQRGVRADETEPGAGFGLAIVRDLAEVYGGSISLEESLLSGLRARLRLPADQRVPLHST
jgi:signal transduction histidine kinase